MDSTTGLLFSDPPLTGLPVQLVFGGGVTPPVVVEPQIKDLLFSQKALTGAPTQLVFGDYGTPAVGVVPVTNAAIQGGVPQSGLAGTMLVSAITALRLAGVIQQPALTARIVVRPILKLHLSAVLAQPLLVVAVEAVYLTNTQRPVVGEAQALHKVVAKRLEVGVQANFQPSHRSPAGVGAQWQAAQSADMPAAALHQQGLHIEVNAGAAHTQAVRFSSDAKALHQDAKRSVRELLASAFQKADRAQTGLLRQRHQDGIRNRTSTLDSDWQVAMKNMVAGLTSRQSPGVPLEKYWDELHNEALRPPAGMYVRPVVAGPPKDVCYTPSTHLLFKALPGSKLIFICEKHDTSPTTPSVTVAVPIRRVYMIFNNASLRRVDGNLHLPNFSMSLSLDVDSWTWGLSATLPGDMLSRLEPASSGAPVEVEALVNGVAYRALVEGISRSREFGKSAINIQCRGKSALLDAPYAQVRNFTNDGERTAQQIMGDVLSVNGVAMDWTLDWQLEDWSVPANAFSHQGSYISALNAIAAAAGGYVQPHASLQTLHVLPRYSAAPWTWASMTADFELPAAVTTRESIEWQERARYNRVYVSGMGQGVLGQITRAGTAGDLLAPMVTDALITTAGVARQRGLSILANTGRTAKVGLRLPVLPETGIIVPGKTVRYVDGGEVRTGVVRSVEVEVAMPEIFQTIGVETYV